MALDCVLSFDTSASDAQLGSTILQAGAEEVFEDELLRYAAPGVLCTLLSASELSQELIQEKFGFIPTRELVFRLNKFEAFEQGIESMLRICIGLICECAGNCLFLIADDVPILLRKNRKLALARSNDPARQRILTKLAEGIDEPFEFVNLPTM